MPVIYAWTYAEFHANSGWEKGADPEYVFWENQWAHAVEAYIFMNSADAPLTDAGDLKDVKTLINRMLVETNIFLKGDATQGGFVTKKAEFPEFKGKSEDNEGIGSGDFILLNKLRDKYSSEGTGMIWSISSTHPRINYGNRLLW